MTELAELDLSGITPAQERQILSRLLRRDFDQWAEQAARVAHCAHPICLTGKQHTVQAGTGSTLSTFASALLPDEVLYVRCNNRRTSWCPSCSRTYQGDTWHLLKAGAAGGDKGVPESVASHPMVFATLTAPSFGPVHAAKKPGSKTQRCRPHARGEVCRHGNSLSCMDIHAERDAACGKPFCGDCYDYDAHVIWQWWAPELWRRFTIALPRLIAKCLRVTRNQARKLVRSSFAKVAEYQARGVIHFHAIIRLDGSPTGDERYPLHWWISTQLGSPTSSVMPWLPWSTRHRRSAEQRPGPCFGSEPRSMPAPCITAPGGMISQGLFTPRP